MTRTIAPCRLIVPGSCLYLRGECVYCGAAPPLGDISHTHSGTANKELEEYERRTRRSMGLD
jgi:hypothetical protein